MLVAVADLLRLSPIDCRAPFCDLPTHANNAALSSKRQNHVLAVPYAERDEVLARLPIEG
jgi:hypothetical protein